MAKKPIGSVAGTRRKSAARGPKAEAARGSRRLFEPMEARSVAEPSEGPEWQYEPKWDGFRCVVLRTARGVRLQSKSGQPLERYFPDLVEVLRRVRAAEFVLDAEIVLPVAGRLSFDDLLMRVHPAASRVKKLAAEHPAMLAIFDLLRDERGRSLLEKPLAERREALEAFAAKRLKGIPELRLSPVTRSLRVANGWFRATGGNLDGIIAKRVDLPYQSGNREGMQKIKHRQTADCVVGGFRYATKGRLVGALLLGMYDTEGLLHHVGFTSAFTAEERARVTKLVKPLIAKAVSFTGQAPGGPSRWSTKRSMEWVSLRPELVVEVEYDHVTGRRFRHGTKVVRWRPDKRARACTLDQIAMGKGSTLKLLGVGRARQ